MARPLAWADSLFNISLITEGAGNVSGDLLATLTPSDTITVMRLIIHLTLMPQNLSDNIDGTVAVDLGIGVAALEAFTAGVVPDPDNPSETPARGWLWRDRMVMTANHITGPPAHDTYQVQEVRADIRAMRKVDRGVLYMRTIAREMNATDFAPVRIVGLIRVLCAT